MALQADAADRALGEQIAFGGTSLDQNVGEVFLQEDALALLGQVWLQGYLDELCLAIRVGGEVNDTAAGVPWVMSYILSRVMAVTLNRLMK